MLFDTDVLIWAFKGAQSACQEIQQDKARAISIVNYIELMQGARNKREQFKIKSFLKNLDFEIVTIDESISHRAMVLIEEFALKSGLRLADALVFATACEKSLTLCSANDKHFSFIEALDYKVFRP